MKKDLDLIMQIKKMLYQERYTIEGVRKRFGEGMLKAAEPEILPEKRINSSQTPAEVIGFVKKRIREILEQLK